MNGEGSIYQRQSDSRWFGSIVEAGEDGKLKRKTVSAKTKDAARIKLKRLMGEQERLQAEGLPPMDTTVTVSQLLDRWHKVIVATRRETLLGPDGVILYQSASGRSVLGYKVGDSWARHSSPLTHPDDAAYSRAQFIKVLHGGQGASVEFECRLRHTDGSWTTTSGPR